MTKKIEKSDDGGQTWQPVEKFEDLLNIEDWEPLPVCSYGHIHAGPCDRPREPGSIYCTWHKDPANRNQVDF